jgi:hypothetical protein
MYLMADIAQQQAYAPWIDAFAFGMISFRGPREITSRLCFLIHAKPIYDYRIPQNEMANTMKWQVVKGYIPNSVT